MQISVAKPDKMASALSASNPLLGRGMMHLLFTFFFN